MHEEADRYQAKGPSQIARKVYPELVFVLVTL